MHMQTICGTELVLVARARARARARTGCHVLGAYMHVQNTDLQTLGSRERFHPFCLFVCSLQFNSDVVGCYLNASSELVQAVDTWNVASGRLNQLDTIQDTFLFNSTMENGTITCT